LILPLGRWVLRSAARQMQTWIDAGMQPLTMAVNVSSVQFTHSDIISDINEAIDYSGLNPELLEIELTESLLLKDFEKGVKILRNMKQLGVQVSIDDFGTGFSSLPISQRPGFSVAEPSWMVAYGELCLRSLHEPSFNTRE